MDPILFLIPAIVIFWSVITYNRLVRDRNRVLAAWSDIDVQLKRRHDLLPKLVEVVKQYTAYEQSTLTEIVELRSRAAQAAGIGERGDLEEELGGGLHKLLALAEDYPDLKANQSFLDLQENISEVEDQLQNARRHYNVTVRRYNTRIESFPDLLIAKAFSYRNAEYFSHDV